MDEGHHHEEWYDECHCLLENRVPGLMEVLVDPRLDVLEYLFVFVLHHLDYQKVALVELELHLSSEGHES